MINGGLIGLNSSSQWMGIRPRSHCGPAAGFWILNVQLRCWGECSIGWSSPKNAELIEHYHDPNFLIVLDGLSQTCKKIPR